MMTKAKPGLSAVLILMGVVATANAKEVSISFILTNDIDQMTGDGVRGGLDRVLGFVAQERAEKGENALFIHAGDAFSPSIMSGFDQGKHIVDLLNLEAPDVFVPGNHEFDFGEDVFRTRVEEAHFPVLAANLVATSTLPENVVPTRMIEIDGLKISFVGAIEEDAVELSKMEALTLSPVLETTQAAAAQLREQGADFVVAVMSTNQTTDHKAVESRAFEMVLSGDDHDLVVFYDGAVVHAESGSQGKYIAAVDVTFTVDGDGEDRDVSWRPDFRIVDTASVSPLPAAAEMVETLEASLSSELDQVVTTFDQEVITTKSVVRTEETVMGNLIADAIRKATNADVGLVNSGSIRGDKVYAGGHELVFRDILTELPFGNTTVVVRVNGEMLKAALENSVSDLENKAGRFLQVSGVAFSYDPAAPVGSRVLEVSVNDAPLEADKDYTLAINNYVLGGGDGFVMFKDAEVLVNELTGDRDANQVIRFLQGGGAITYNLGERISKVSAQ